MGVDLRWTKLLRSMRVLRVGLLSSELKSLHLRCADSCCLHTSRCCLAGCHKPFVLARLQSLCNLPGPQVPCFDACAWPRALIEAHACSTRKGGFLSAGTNFRLFQLLTSVAILLFTTASVIQMVEHMPFHQALYMVRTCWQTVADRIYRCLASKQDGIKDPMPGRMPFGCLASLIN
jgi:hypothetical protein